MEATDQPLKPPSSRLRVVVVVLVVVVAGLAWLTRGLWWPVDEEYVEPVRPVYQFDFTVDADQGPEPVEFYLKYHGEEMYLDFTFRGIRYWVSGVQIGVSPLDKLPAERVARTKPGGLLLEQIANDGGVRGSVDLTVTAGTLTGLAQEATITRFLDELDQWGSDAADDSSQDFDFPLSEVRLILDLPDADVTVTITKLHAVDPPH